MYSKKCRTQRWNRKALLKQLARALIHSIADYSYLSQKVNWNNLPTAVVVCVFHHNQSGPWLVRVVLSADAILKYVKVKCSIRLVWNDVRMKSTNLIQTIDVKKWNPRPDNKSKSSALISLYPLDKLLKSVVLRWRITGTNIIVISRCRNCNFAVSTMPMKANAGTS